MIRARRSDVGGILVVLLVLLTTGCNGNTAGPDPASSQESASASTADAAEDLIGQLVDSGIAQAQAGDLGAAEVTFRNALALDPGNQFALFNLGLLAQTQGKTKVAIGFYDRALATDPDYTPALYNKAILLEPTGLEVAVAIYERIIEIDPEASTTYLRLSFAYRELGDTERADEMRAKAVELDPTLAEVTELPEA